MTKKRLLIGILILAACVGVYFGVRAYLDHRATLRSVNEVPFDIIAKQSIPEDLVGIPVRFASVSGTTLTTFTEEAVQTTSGTYINRTDHTFTLADTAQITEFYQAERVATTPDIGDTISAPAKDGIIPVISNLSLVRYGDALIVYVRVADRDTERASAWKVDIIHY